ncbi:hypothetical protein QU670_00500 [Actinomyces massiliensis]|uniref:Uncharacterized protein n=1 Tax=Actinomyces massiliensis F0489 TaxID=1125718 RepID=J0NDC9_9ACTO|nr:hypothetical protein [Actinomyces massiliensis]EJF42617.1 hypothetical protein HMPREF1318_2449 [Actinomyces massiliensis F0489]WLD71773.1 hypothetical protein QU670_00500 [Actinomyces massiliensis]
MTSPPDQPSQSVKARSDERPRPLLHKLLTAASITCLSAGVGLTLIPIVAHLMSALGVLSIAMLGGDLPGRERDLFCSGLAILLSCAVVLAMQLWIRRDPLTRSSAGSAAFGINLLDFSALVGAVVILADLAPAHYLGARFLIVGGFLLALGIVLLPPRPREWPPQAADDGGLSPLQILRRTLRSLRDPRDLRSLRALRSPRLWIRAAAIIGVIVLTIVSAEVYSAWVSPTRAFSASESRPSGSGPDLFARTSDSGTWTVQFKQSLFIDYAVTAAGPIALSAPKEEDTSDSRNSAVSTYESRRLDTLTVTLLDPTDGSPQWSLELTSPTRLSTGDTSRSGSSHNLSDYLPTSFPNEDNPAIGRMVTDPDGQLLAIRLKPTWNKSAKEWITPIAVIDLTSGGIVGSAEIQGEIVSTVLTSDTLAIQTADDSPLETGGTILTYSLNRENGYADFQSTAKVSTWLVGATRDRLLLSDQSPYSIHDPNSPKEGRAATVTLATPARVDEASKITGVRNIFPGGWVELLSGPDQQTRELVDLNTDQRIDITGMTAESLDTNTGNQVELIQKEPGTNNKTTVGNINISTPATSAPTIESPGSPDSVLRITDKMKLDSTYTDSLITDVSRQRFDLYAIPKEADS